MRILLCECRNITGKFGWSAVSNRAMLESGSYQEGVFYPVDSYNARLIMQTSNSYGAYKYLGFDASRVVSTTTENRPYNIAFLPLIAY